MRRGWPSIALWTGLVLVLLVAAAVWLLPRWLGSDLSKARLEALLSEALGREVTIESLEIADDAPAIELRGVTVAQPPSLAVPEEGPLLYAELVRLEVSLEELLARRVVGVARAHGVTLVVLERQGKTSVHGLGPPKSTAAARGEPGEPGEPIELALGIELHDVALRLLDLDRGEAIDVRDVAVRGHLGDELGDGPNSAREAMATLTAAALEVRGVALHDLMVQATLDETAIELPRVRAEVGEHGILEGRGRLGLPSAKSKDERDWSVELTLTDAELDGPLRDLVATAVPVMVRATGSEGEPTTGRLGATVAIEGRGLRWASIEPSLRGTASLTLRDVEMPATATLLQLAELAGREPGPWTIATASAELRVEDGWLHPGAIVLGELRPRLEGRVSLQGQLDLTLDLMPLVEAFGGGTYAAVARTTTRIPVRITGTVREPELAPPRARDVAAGLLGGAVRRALTPDPE